MLKRLFSLSKTSGAKKTAIQPLPPLEDADYEYLFLQLLEGVAHGWQQDRILRFFRVLGDRGKPDLWIDWLNRYQEKLAKAPTIDNNLAMRMVQMGERQGGEMGDLVHSIGMKMLTGFQIEDVFTTIADEFESQPLIITDSEPPSTLETETETIDQDPTQTVSLNELLTMMQMDSNLRIQVANQFGIESDDPVQIIEQLIEKLQISQE
jgi:hypothetical protein